MNDFFGCHTSISDYMDLTNPKSDNVIIFGAGYLGCLVMYLCKYVYGIKQIECMDNDRRRKDLYIWDDIPCRLPYKNNKNSVVYICVWDKKSQVAIDKQCKSLGYENVYCIDDSMVLFSMKDVSDVECVKAIYYAATGNHVDLERPTKFNEKLQWLKVYDRNPLYQTLTDKLAVKEYVKKIIGEKYIVPTIGIWDTFEDIDFTKLPNQFVLKCTHDSGSAVVVNDKQNIDLEELSKRFSKALSIDYYYVGREHGYKNIPRKIIAEPKLNGDSVKDIKDYKVFTFDGDPRIVQVDYDRFHSHTRIMYDAKDWKSLGFSTMYPYDASKIEEKPAKLEEMLELSRILSKGIPHVRVDFYIVGDRVYFGEMTFHHGGGCEKFSDENWNDTMGEWIRLPKK
ncbi:MAG: glycosyl transferase [Butyrivibrio sp.]|nr:glycosyl transferase [Butyrivibrio sp.]